MQITKIDNTIFTSKKITTFKDLWKFSHDPRFSDIKPIKNYSQYLKEYGLDLKSKKK